MRRRTHAAEVLRARRVHDSEGPADSRAELPVGFLDNNRRDGIRGEPRVERALISWVSTHTRQEGGGLVRMEDVRDVGPVGGSALAALQSVIEPGRHTRKDDTLDLTPLAKVLA